MSGMFDAVAKKYDVMNTVASLGQVYIWRAATVAAIDPQPGMRILDVAAGTGTSSETYARRGARVVASDFSEGMIAEGRKRYPHLEFVHADAMNLPFDDASFDVVTISYGLRNIQDPSKALAEMFRVLKPGGRIVICEFSTPAFVPFRRVYRWYLGTVMPQVARTLSSDDVAYDYLVESILDWPNQQAVGSMMKAAGFSLVQYRNLSAGIVAIHRAVKPSEAA